MRIRLQLSRANVLSVQEAAVGSVVDVAAEEVSADPASSIVKVALIARKERRKKDMDVVTGELQRTNLPPLKRAKVKKSRSKPRKSGKRPPKNSSKRLWRLCLLLKRHSLSTKLHSKKMRTSSTSEKPMRADKTILESLCL